uniref:Endothelin-converting enzyme 1 n=1 Tax=Timema bartmani TaxID=61472 RepID=A0A7R9HYC5_9NEOP|nr:unnamed protein product [Timema bartmani]
MDVVWRVEADMLAHWRGRERERTSCKLIRVDGRLYRLSSLASHQQETKTPLVLYLSARHVTSLTQSSGAWKRLNLFLSWGGISNPLGTVVPMSDNSTRPFARMIPKMNSSAAPCEDMWNYACGNWLKRHLVPVTQSKWGTTQELQAKCEFDREQLRSLIVTLPHPVKLSSVTWKLKHFYESCMALDNLETDKDQPLHRIINELGGWNVLREFSHFSWDYRVNLVKLHSQYGVSPFFKISVVPDPDNPERGVIKVSPAGLGLPDRSYYYRRPDSQVEASYKRYLKDAVQKLGATSTEAATFSEEIYHFEKRIAEVTPEWSALQNPLTSYTKISIGEFENKASSIPLHDIIMAKYPTAKIDDTTEVLIPSDNYLTHISSIITTSDRGNLNNYMMWNFAMAYLPYLSQDYRDIVNLYRKELTGIQEPPQRWEMCVDTTQKYLGFSLAALHERGVPFDTRQEDQAVVNSMFENIKDAAKNSIQKSGWLDSKLQQYTLEKLNSLALQVGYPPSIQAELYLDSYYKEMYVQKNNFFQNILYGVAFLQATEMSKLLAPAEEHRWMAVMAGVDAVSYIPEANKVVVPYRLLMSPYFHRHYPLSILYGTLGMQVASAVVSSILPWNVLLNPSGRLLSQDNPIVNQSLRAAQWPRRFIAERIVKNQATEHVANQTALQTVIDISALKQAYNAVNRLPHTHQPALEQLENDALFFLSYTQSLCSVSTVQQQDIDTSLSSKLEGSKLLRISLQQVPAFSDAYGCSADSSYLHSQLCEEIW